MPTSDQLLEEAPVQDRDLLQRLSLYFDALESRLRQGQGWFIFNADGNRSGRIASFIEARVGEYESHVSSYFVPWRDFAITAYVRDVSLPELASGSANANVRKEFELATALSYQTTQRLLESDLLVLVGLKPSSQHEARLLDQTVSGRWEQRLATILLTPEMPHQLADDLNTVDPSHHYWDRLFERMYQTSLVAL